MAIRHGKKTKDIEGLRKDILNAPKHIFGDHSKCEQYFCNGTKANEKNCVPEMTVSGFFNNIEKIIRQVAMHAKSLIKDVDSSSVESFNYSKMCIRKKNKLFP